jgi:PAS domain S-box-containing protein
VLSCRSEQRCSFGIFRLDILLLAAWSSFALWGEAPAAPKRILVLMPLESLRPGSREILEGLQNGLREVYSERVDVFVEFIMQATVTKEDFADRRLQWLLYKYGGQEFDAICSIQSESMALAEELQRRLWPKAAVVFALTKNAYRPEYLKGPHRTGVVAELGDHERALRAALKLLPETRRMALLAGSAYIDRGVYQEVAQQIRRVDPSLEIIPLSGLSLAEVKTRVSNLPEKTIVYIAQVTYDATGRSLTEAELATILSEVTNRPLFSPRTFAFGHGTVGGPMSSFERSSEEQGKLVARVLRGEDPKNIPLGSVPFTNAVDWRQLRKWGIPEDRLPPGTEIRFRELTLWEQFRMPILLGSGALLLQALIIGILLAERRRRARLEREARASENLNRAILSSLNAGIAILDRNGIVICVSDNWKQSRAPGYYPPAVTGEDYLDIWRDWSNTPESTQDISAAVEAVLSGRERLQSISHHVQLQDEEYWIEVRVERLARTEGGAVVSHLDITSRRRAELDRRRSLEELHHMNRIATVGELAGSLAHELAQPLASILSNAQAASRFVNRPEPDLEEVRQALREIADDDRRARTIIDGMRKILKKQPRQAQELDLNLVVIEVNRLVRSVLQVHGVLMILELTASSVQVKGDTVPLQQVLLNLVNNAIDAVRVQPRGLRRLTVRTSSNGRWGEMVVEDNGPGISEGVRERLFDSFFTTKQEGLGMGLSICRSIVEDLGGQISADNRQGGGASFRVSLPLAGTAEPPRGMTSSAVV